MALPVGTAAELHGLASAAGRALNGQRGEVAGDEPAAWKKFRGVGLQAYRGRFSSVQLSTREKAVAGQRRSCAIEPPRRVPREWLGHAAPSSLITLATPATLDFSSRVEESWGSLADYLSVVYGHQFIEDSHMPGAKRCMPELMKP